MFFRILAYRRDAQSNQPARKVRQTPSNAQVRLRGFESHHEMQIDTVYDKTAWLSERGIDLSWPVAGLPGILHSDNGAEFHSRALTGACREYGIKIQYRPPATPRFGGHVERLIGTMMGAVHILPGTTFSNIKLKENYDAEGRAIFTLRELEAWIGHCQSKFYTARSRTGAGWTSAVFAHELPPRSAGFDAENRLYLFALTMPHSLL